MLRSMPYTLTSGMTIKPQAQVCHQANSNKQNPVQNKHHACCGDRHTDPRPARQDADPTGHMTHKVPISHLGSQCSHVLQLLVKRLQLERCSSIQLGTHCRYCASQLSTAAAGSSSSNPCGTECTIRRQVQSEAQAGSAHRAAHTGHIRAPGGWGWRSLVGQLHTAESGAGSEWGPAARTGPGEAVSISLCSLSSGASPQSEHCGKINTALT